MFVNQSRITMPGKTANLTTVHRDSDLSDVKDSAVSHFLAGSESAVSASPPTAGPSPPVKRDASPPPALPVTAIIVSPPASSDPTSSSWEPFEVVKDGSDLGSRGEVKSEWHVYYG